MMIRAIRFTAAAALVAVACRSDARRSPRTEQAAATIPHDEHNPWIENADSAPAIHLPRSMARALAQTFPHFQPWPWKAYPRKVRALYDGSDRSGVRAVVGDFNGDGHLDVALDGSDSVAYPRGGGSALVTIIALLTSGDSAVAVPVTEGSLTTGDSVGVPRPRWLALLPAGSYRAALDKDAVGVSYAVGPRRDLPPSQVYVWWQARSHFVQWSDGE